MSTVVYRVLVVVCDVVAGVPVGTNRSLVDLCWMVLSGQLLSSRGGVIPGLAAMGLPAPAVRRAWAALGQGAWTIGELIARWHQVVAKEGKWQARRHGGYGAVAADVTHIVRPRLKSCGRREYLPGAKQTVPTIPVGIVARVGEVGRQRLGQVLTLVRADGEAASRSAHAEAVVQALVAGLGLDEVGVLDRGFPVSLLQAQGCARFVVRLLKNFTARRALTPAATIAAKRGPGRPRQRGEVVRPLARTRQGRTYPATAPDRTETWTDEAGRTVRADWWEQLVRPDAAPEAPHFQVVAIHDPRYEEPLLLATSVALSGAEAQALYLDRWAVEQLPLAAKQMLGAQRQFVHAPETCQRLPELTLLLGSILSYLAATHPPVSTGFWDRSPQPTPGRFRRLLARQPFPQTFPWPPSIRQKASVTAHLPKGHAAPRHHTPNSPPPSLASVSGN
jgi:hypothetical protein